MIDRIEGLYRIPEERFEDAVETLKDALASYPKLSKAFDTREKVLTGIEATIRLYFKYDIYFGAAFSLDEDISEVIAVVESEEMDYTDERYEMCGVDDSGYLEVLDRFSEEDRKRWFGVFDELDEKEAALEFPTPHLYVDYLGVKTSLHGNGRGRALLGKVCEYADSRGLPMMLFTNTDYDIRFYMKNGFEVVDVTVSEEYGFENTYLVRMPKAQLNK